MLGALILATRRAAKAIGDVVRIAETPGAEQLALKESEDTLKLEQFPTPKPDPGT